MAFVDVIALGALIVSSLALLRSFSKDGKNHTADLTTVIVKLETIGNDTIEIKKDIRGVKSDVREHGERIVKVEQKVESLEKIINMHHVKDAREE